MGNKVLKVALFAAFLVCLYVSIPHLAWTFHSWESGPTDTPLVVNLWLFTVTTSYEWFNAYLQSMSIDVIIALLSITLTNSKRKTQTGIGYTFVTLLIAISWFFNWMYAKAHAPAQSSIWTHSEFWGLIHLDTLTPIITSALPVFALAFTVMIDRLTGEKMTAEQLAQEANDLEALTIQQRRIAEIKRSNNINGATSLIDAGANIFGHLGSKIKKQKPLIDDQSLDSSMNSSDTDIDQSDADVNQLNGTVDQSDADVNQRDTEELHLGKITSINANTSRKNVDQLTQDGSDHQSILPAGLSGHSTMSIDDAAKLIDCDVERVISLRDDGVLKSSARNKDLITVASINRFVESRRKINQTSFYDEVINQTSLNETNINQSDEMNKLTITLEILRDDQSITDEELAKKLNLKRPASARFWRLKAMEMLRMATINS